MERNAVPLEGPEDAGVGDATREAAAQCQAQPGDHPRYRFTPP
jgi:hypothetical protein